MQLPDCFPNPEQNSEAIEALLERVRGLDKDAKERLALMLDQEMDLPYLDAMERQYAEAFRRASPQNATSLRGRFVVALNEQRTFLVDLVRNVLQSSLENDAHRVQPGA